MAKVVYAPKKWMAFPVLMTKFFELSGPEQSVLIALYLRSKGFKKYLTLTNDQLMKLSGIKRQQTFVTARRALMRKHGLIRFHRLEGFRIYEYELLDDQLSPEERLAPAATLKATHVEVADDADADGEQLVIEIDTRLRPSTAARPPKSATATVA